MVRGYHGNILSTPSYTPSLCVWSPVGPDKSDGANCDSDKNVKGLIHKTNCTVFYDDRLLNQVSICEGCGCSQEESGSGSNEATVLQFYEHGAEQSPQTAS